MTTENSFNQSMATPVRVKMPKMSRKRAAAPTPLETPDRFIPNRGRMMNMSKSSFLFSTASKKQKTTTTIQEKNYDQQLRSVLLGKHTNSPDRLMEFGPTKKKHRTSKVAPTRLFGDDPYRHDVLRTVLNENQENKSRCHRNWTKVTMECVTALDAPQMNTGGELLSLLGAGKEFLAVALDTRVYLWKKGYIELLAEADSTWTCVEWAPDGEFLALGTMEKIIVYHIRSCARKPIAKMACASEVTAMAWKGRELLATFTEEPTARYDLEVLPDAQGFTPIQTSYEGHGGPVVSSLRWNSNVIVSAGGGVIKMFDSSKGGENVRPRRVMEHIGVKHVEFCPQQPNLVVSSGDGGLKFWNTWNGKLRSSIPMEDSVTATICSGQRPEILVAHATSLSLWSLATNNGQKLYEQKVDAGVGNIINFKRGLNGLVVCGHTGERLSMYAMRREVSKEAARAVVGTLITAVPTLR